MRIRGKTTRIVFCAALLAGAATSAWAQPVPPPGPPVRIGTTGLSLDQITLQSGPESVGRAAPAPETPTQYVGPETLSFSARDGAVPEGIEPLERTIFNTDDFYADRDLWMDPRYYHCASPAALDSLWENMLEIGDGETALPVGDSFPETMAWGDCNVDYPRDQMVSPYPFETAQEHYETLLAETQSRGGPTIHTGETLPDWTGEYSRIGFTGSIFELETTAFSGWLRGHITQMPTYLSVLTPEYQERLVQQMYHTATTNAPQWPGSYCWPEGFLRRWFAPGRSIIMSQDAVLSWTAISETLFTEIVFGQSFNMEGEVPRLGDDIRRWFGETIGFWDGDVLITWTSNIRGWIAHGSIEWSDLMQTIEIYTPLTGPDGAFVGINHETVLYDPEALVEPVRVVDNWEWSKGLNEGAPFRWNECFQTLFPVDGFVTPVNPGETVEYTVPDMANRPWAQIWEQYFEQDMTGPARTEETEGLFGF